MCNKAQGWTKGTTLGPGGAGAPNPNGVVANGDHKRLVLRPAGRNPIGVDPFLVAASRQSAAIPGSDLHRRSAETPLRRASGPNACAKATGGPPRCGIRTVSRGLWTADCGLQTVDRGFTRPAPAAAKPETSTCHNSHPSHKSHCPQVPRLKPRPEDVPPSRSPGATTPQRPALRRNPQETANICTMTHSSPPGSMERDRAFVAILR